jgi:hypothetical protein
MLFSRDADSMPRIWTGKEDIKAITKDARAAVLFLHLLSLLCHCFHYLEKELVTLRVISLYLLAPCLVY